MDNRFSYLPITWLPVMIVVSLWITLLIWPALINNINFTFFSMMPMLFVYSFYFKSALVYRPSGTRSALSKLDNLIDKVSGKGSILDLYKSLGSDKFVSEYTVYRIVTLAYSSAFIVFAVIYLITMPEGVGVPEDPIHNLLFSALFVSGIIAYTSYIRLLTIRQELYQYYLAKAYLELSENEIKNFITLAVGLRHFREGLEAYNRFLQRILNIKIKNLQSFYSIVSSDEITDRQESMNSIYQSFHKDEEWLDELKPLRAIRKRMEVAYKKDLITGTGSSRNIQQWLPLIGLVVTSVIGIIQLLITK